MTFQSDRQISHCCVTLLQRAGLGDRGLWTTDGPTDLATKWHRRSPLSHGEHIILQVCWSLWGGKGKANVGDVFYVLDAKLAHDVGSLLIAVANSRVGEWLYALNNSPEALNRKPSRAVALKLVEAGESLAESEGGCADCGEPGTRTGHQDCASDSMGGAR